MAAVLAARSKPNFNILYFDTNVLVRSKWPSPGVQLGNIFFLAQWWGIRSVIPEPVLIEAEEHWVRGLEGKARLLSNAAAQLERTATPLTCPVKIDHPSILAMVESYRSATKAAFQKHKVETIPFTTLSCKELFPLAARYAPPFVAEQEGRGFQDAVIFSSVAQHLKTNPKLTGVLTTADQVFSNLKPADFEPSVEGRLQVLDLDQALDALYSPYWDEAVKKPYEIERANAMKSASAAVPALKEFVAANLTESMLKGEWSATVLKLRTVDELQVLAVQTPIPPPGAADRTVRFAISVSVNCTATIEHDYSLVYKMLWRDQAPPKPSEEEGKAFWLGGIETTANIVSHEFRDLKPIALITVDEIWSDRFSKE